MGVNVQRLQPDGQNDRYLWESQQAAGIEAVRLGGDRATEDEEPA